MDVSFAIHIVQIQIIRCLRSGENLKDKDNLTFRCRHRIQRVDGDRVKVGIYLLADEFNVLLGICHAHYTRVVIHSEEQRASFRIGKGTDAFEPITYLSSL